MQHQRPHETLDIPLFREPVQSFLRYAVAFILTGSVVFLLALFVLVPDQPLRALGPAGTALVVLIAWYLLSRGMTTASVQVLAFGFWAVATAIAFFTGGLASMALMYYPLLVLLLGWMAGTRAAVAIGVLVLATTLGLALADWWGVLPLPPPTPPAMRWIIHSLVFVFSVILIVNIVRSYQSRLNEVSELGGDLNRAQAVAHIGSWVYDLAGDTLRLSAETCRIFGVPDGVTGSHKTYLASVHPDDRARVDGAWQAALKGGAPFDNEHRILVGDAVRWVRQKAELEFGADGRALRSVGTTQDVTERVHLEQALREQTERLLIGQRAAGMVIMDWDILKDELRWSDSPEWLRGPLPESGKYPLYIDQVHPEDRERFRAVRSVGIETLQPHGFEYRIVRTDGQIRWVLSQRLVLAGADGKAARMLVALQDITGRKQSEARQDELAAQLRESQKMQALGTLAGGVAHDFNNIVATIIGNAELVRQDVGPAHAALESLDEIRKASQRAKALVQQILAFGRRQVPVRKLMALAPVVEESARLLRATLPSGVGLSVKCAPDAPLVLADATQVQQVLLNLCSNAWHAIEGQGRPGAIEILLEVRDQIPVNALSSCAMPERNDRSGRGYACLTVRDNGSGMEEETVTRIFEPFFTTKPVGKGTGLGLAVVHGIVQSHGARIDVQSAPGEGTSFRICFPAAQAQTTPAPAPDRIPASGRGEHILYVDDDESIVSLMTRLLERQGYRVSAYIDPHEALAAVRVQPEAIDLAVTDYNMPGMSGLEVAIALREIRADLPILLASGHITEELRAQAPAAGVSELIHKPDAADELCELVARLANARRGDANQAGRAAARDGLA